MKATAVTEALADDGREAPRWNEAGGHRLTPMDRLFLAIIVTALMLLVFSSALLVDRSQSPVTLIERPEKAKGGRP